jgi:hypothetical protein
VTQARTNARLRLATARLALQRRLEARRLKLNRDRIAAETRDRERVETDQEKKKREESQRALALAARGSGRSSGPGGDEPPPPSEGGGSGGGNGGGRRAANDNHAPIKTLHGLALQSMTPTALAARKRVLEGATLYKLGTTNKSAAPESQFWSLSNPMTPAGTISPEYAKRYGVPAQNIAQANFVQRATLKPGTSFITREAPGVGDNGGGEIEVVVPEGGVVLGTFVYIDGQKP